MAGDHHADDRDKYQRRLTALEHKLVEHEPVWLRDGTDESRWQVIIALAIIMVFQFLMDGTYFPVALRPLIALEGLLLAVLLAINVDGLRGYPKPFGRKEQCFLAGLLFLITASGAATALLLDWKIIQRQQLPNEIGGVVSDNSSILLLSGALIIVTNIVVFGILYWLIDLGGPQKRAGKHGAKIVDPRHPDFLFPQQNMEHPNDWEPRFMDYLYISYTNVVAFSPTDAMPLTKFAKAMMAVQSALAVSTLALVIARAVNVLNVLPNQS